MSLLPVGAAPATSRRGQAGGALPGLLLPLTFSPSPAARGGSAQIRSRTGGPPSLEIVHGGPTRLQPWTETPESLATRGGPTPQPPRKGRRRLQAISGDLRPWLLGSGPAAAPTASGGRGRALPHCCCGCLLPPPTPWPGVFIHPIRFANNLLF
ncbi:uncharacterized protein [Triticum aestivum]|uniref:uncharacterized protein isoform X3 n=1 Tax=Triticum aestivum TaxID=4565 RepID=UPI001D02F0DB|nr:uncharacterized protein LOC123164390 isoform X3 [Triticum aestivum]